MNRKKLSDRTHTDIVANLETLGTKGNAQVLSIGAVRFRLGLRDDAESLEEEHRSFYARLDTEDQGRKGRTTSARKVQWWKAKQSEGGEVLEEEPELPVHALRRFAEFCMGGRTIWCDGEDFTHSTLRNLCEDYDIKLSVDSWNNLSVSQYTSRRNFREDVGSNKDSPYLFPGERRTALRLAKRLVLRLQQAYLKLNKELYGSKYDQV